ncbi:MAG: hypothetical protein CSA75_01100, partial [Sorangium cellulosum]
MTIRVLILILAISSVGAAGCCKSNETGDQSGDHRATATPSVAAVGNKRFEGSYSSNWGTTHFKEIGGIVSAKYSRGTMTCKAARDVLSCEWFEGNATGKARLTRQADGSLRGTWGKGTSETNGG